MTGKIFAKKKAPSICVPLTGKTRAEVLEQLEQVLPEEPDIIEWRADFLADITDTELVIGIIEEIKAKTDIPLLFTIRAEHEGGEKITLSEGEKVALLRAVCEETAVDVIDFETSNRKEDVKMLRRVSREHGKQLILSYHNFDETPANEELVKRARQAEDFDADVVKLAVMPHAEADVLRLLEVTKEIDDLLEVPIVTMSMAELGGLSRMIGWAYGSVMTFGVGVESSAPGQIPVQKLKETIQLMQELVPNWE